MSNNNNNNNSSNPSEDIKVPFNEPTTDKEAYGLELKHVHQIYDVISSHFDNTRYKMVGAIGVDVGCGNGKYLNINSSNIFSIGSDICSSFASISAQKGSESLVADGLILPYKTNSFDYAISIAVIHHFSTVERRVNALREVVRVLKPGGVFLVTAWAMTQKWKGKNYDSQDVMVPWMFQQKFSNGTENTTEIESTPVQKSGTNYQKFHRYYHLFDEGEFEHLFSQVSNIEILSNNLDHDNYYCFIRKLE
ncbi:Hypothetical Generic methyl-transferase/SAM [Heterostelium album PN500]|uniref:Hypothetical Generic methyl-transferase/SAM n=1 Tax=Heterostelium pallidum (strain ATCC 26659 / Pp 5 / PN500) TaxID=670386 RepID=D3B4X6_HETP5|nr:Hypothetical Generic methyl-transferase/SAM [Heterostelium album PN500]EFA84374.1 Hypothetical Generic methyl-transferase/SAM [Heterostelium album PN500]|eukprot:XP_020436489.1 Hypothetical Generic methyl-transferase/SAM [Heterostelium album PN500]